MAGVEAEQGAGAAERVAHVELAATEVRIRLPAVSAADDVTLNFENADIRQSKLEDRIDALTRDLIRHTWQVVGFIAVVAGLLMAAAKYL